MRYTQKRNGVNEIPLPSAVCGIDMPYWRIDRADDLHSYLSGDAADKLAAYEDTGLTPEQIAEYLNATDGYVRASEEGRLIVLPKALYEADATPLITGVTKWKVTGALYYDGTVQAYILQTKNVQTIIYGREIGKTWFLAREEAEAALKGESADV